MWSEYHRGQARTLAHLAQLTRNPNTAESLMRLAAKHAEMADRAESQRSNEAKSGSVPSTVKLYAGERSAPPARSAPPRRPGGRVIGFGNSVEHE